jgi:hypothetical protein
MTMVLLILLAAALIISVLLPFLGFRLGAR